MINNLDCGDNSCYFATKKGGMRTNGGCHCFENAGYGRSATAAAYKMLPEVIKLRGKLVDIKNEMIITKLGEMQPDVELLKHYADEALNEDDKAEKE